MRFCECRLWIFNEVRRIGDESMTNFHTAFPVAFNFIGLGADFDVVEKTLEIFGSAEFY